MGFEPQTFRPTVRRVNHCATGAGLLDVFVCHSSWKRSTIFLLKAERNEVSFATPAVQAYDSKECLIFPAQFPVLLEACMSMSFSNMVNVCFGNLSRAFFGVSANTWGSWSYFLCTRDIVLYHRIPCGLVFYCWHIAVFCKQKDELLQWLTPSLFPIFLTHITASA